MRNNYTLEKFSNIGEFSSIIQSMDDYRVLPIYAEYANRKISSDRVWGMTNITNNRITMAVGKQYPVFGHRESLGVVCKDLQARQVNVHGSITTMGDTSFTKILFSDLKVNDAKDGIELGISFKNPMGAKTKFTGNGYTYRQVCSNGAGVKTLLPQLEISESHTIDMLNVVPMMIHDFISKSLTMTDHLQHLVKTAMETRVKFDSKEQLTQTMTNLYYNVSERHVKGIVSNIGTLEPTRMELFNASSFFTSHTGISPTVRDDIDSIAEQFLSTTRPIIPAYMKKAIAPIVVA